MAHAFAFHRMMMFVSVFVVLAGMGTMGAILAWASGWLLPRQRAGLLAGTILVLIGLGTGTWAALRAQGDAAVLVQTTAEQLRHDSDAGIAALKAEIDADRAKRAATRDELSRQAAALTQRVADANRDAEAAKAEQVRLTGLLEDATRQTEQLRLAEEQLKAQLAWREILPAGQEKMATALADGGGNVTIVWVNNDPEALNLAIQLSEVFRAANKAAGERKWNVRGVPRSYGTVLLRGLFLPGPDNAALGAIRAAFDTVGMAYSTDDAPNTPTAAPGEAMIVVGTKPLPF